MEASGSRKMREMNKFLYKVNHLCFLEQGGVIEILLALTLEGRVCGVFIFKAPGSRHLRGQSASGSRTNCTVTIYMSIF